MHLLQIKQAAHAGKMQGMQLEQAKQAEMHRAEKAKMVLLAEARAWASTATEEAGNLGASYPVNPDLMGHLCLREHVPAQPDRLRPADLQSRRDGQAGDVEAGDRRELGPAWGRH